MAVGEVEQSDQSSGGGRLSVTEMVAGWVRQHPPPSPGMDIASKVTSEHIARSLDVADAHDKRVSEDLKDRRKDSRSKLAMALIAGIVVVAMLVFSDNDSLLGDLVTWVTLLGAGAFGGHGFAKRSG